MLSIDLTLISMYYHFKLSYMHRRPKAERPPLDTELERTLRNLMKVRLVEASVMAEQEEINQNEPVAVVERPQKQRTMEDFRRPIVRDEHSAISQPIIEEAKKF